MKNINTLVLAALFLVPQAVNATPSTQIWIPSTDIQKYKSVHLNVDNYVAVESAPDGSVKSPVFMAGPTIGVLPFEKIQAEVGFDLMKTGSKYYDNSPVYLNAKIGTPEGILFVGSPAFAIGGYNFGTKKDLTDQDVIYGLAAKNLPKLGRFSAGYYTGNDKVLLDDKSKKANNGVLLSWDRTMTEISDKLWAAVDYQGGNSSLGALSFGVAWAFAANTSVIFGYDIYNNNKVALGNTCTVQLDINLW